MIPSLVLGGFFFTLRLFFAYVPIYYESLGFIPIQIGVLMATFPLSSVFLSLPFGRLTDRYTQKGLTILGLILFWAFSFLFGYVRDLWAILFVVVAGSVGATLFRISCFSLFYKSTPSGGEGKRFGVVNSGLLIGFGTGPFVGGYLLKYIDFESFFKVVPLFLIPSLLLSLLLKEERVEFKRDSNLKALLLKKEVIAFLVLIFIFSLHIGVENVWLSIFLKEEIQMREEMIGVVYFAVGITLGVSALITGFLVDRMKRPLSLLGVGLFISGTLNILLPFLTTFIQVTASRSIHVIGDSIFLVTFRLMALRLFPKEGLGGGVGLTQATFTSGILVGSLLSGLFQWASPPFILVGLLSIASISSLGLISRSI